MTAIRRVRGVRLLGVLAAALAASSASAQRPDFITAWSGFWTVSFGGAGNAASRLGDLPAGTVAIDDAGGGELAAGEFGGLTLSARALEQVRNYDYATELLPENACRAPSVAFYMQAPFPMEIHAGRDLIVFRMEFFDLYRVVFLDGRDHPPADAPHTLSGHSVGHWEGDTLVIDTTHIASGTLMNNGFDHSENLRMTERYRLSEDGASLVGVQIYRDPETFEGTAARYLAWLKRPGEYLLPYDCDPNYGG